MKSRINGKGIMTDLTIIARDLTPTQVDDIIGLVYAKTYEKADLSIYVSNQEQTDEEELSSWFPVTRESYTDEYPLPVIGRGQLDTSDDIAVITIEVYDPKHVYKLRAEGLKHLNLTDRTTD